MMTISFGENGLAIPQKHACAAAVVVRYLTSFTVYSLSTDDSFRRYAYARTTTTVSSKVRRRPRSSRMSSADDASVGLIRYGDEPE
jgi:hypothetical protein